LRAVIEAMDRGPSPPDLSGVRGRPPPTALYEHQNLSAMARADPEIGLTYIPTVPGWTPVGAGRRATAIEGSRCPATDWHGGRTIMICGIAREMVAGPSIGMLHRHGGAGPPDLHRAAQPTRSYRPLAAAELIRGGVR